jgi:hypothetical protein
METEDKYAHARENALASMASIREMVARLEHCRECDGEDCELTEFGEFDSEDYHDEDSAREAIEEDALSVEARSGWHSPGGDSEDEEFRILLTTGGPALRIIGDLGRWNTPENPRLEMQDWFIPWQEVELQPGDSDILETYCGVFYFG